MSNVIVVLVLMALSFTAGLLVYRKNGKRIEADALKAKAEADPDVTILVRADEAIAYGKVVAILRMMHDANISRMALVTSPEK